MTTERTVGLIWTTVVVLAISVLAVACTPAGPTTPAPSSPTPAPTAQPSPPPSVAPSTPTPVFSGTVTIWLDWGLAEMRGMERLIEAYRQLHPSSRFEVVYHRSEDLRGEFEAAVEAGSPPSLLIGPSDWGDPLYEAGALRNVAEAVLPDQREALHPLAWAQVDRGEVILGLPLDLQGTLLYRNRSFIESQPDTVAEFVVAGQMASRAGAIGEALDLGFSQSAPMLRTCRGEFTLEPGSDPIARPAGLCWLRLLDRLGQAAPVVFGSQEDLQSFTIGRSAWLLESSEMLPELLAAVGSENLAVNDWPLYEPTGEQLTGYVWTENLYFPRQVEDEDFEAAFAFAVYLLAPDSQRKLAAGQRVQHIPVLREAELENPLLAGARSVLEQGVARPDLRQFDRIATELNTAVRLVVAQGGEPELALELALQEIRQATAPTATPTPTTPPTATPTPTDTPFPSPPPG